MAGTVTRTAHDLERTITRFDFKWTSDSTGLASGFPFEHYRGSIIAVAFAPGAGGAQPTNNYDVTLMCERHGADLLNGAGADLSNVIGAHRAVFMQTIEKGAFVRQWCHGGKYELVVSGAGASKSGTVELYVYHGVL